MHRQESAERINHKRVWRVYRDLGLSVRRTRRKRLARALRSRPVLTAPNQEWAMDFASDVAASGRVNSFPAHCRFESQWALPAFR